MFFFFFQAEDGIRDLVRSRGLGDVYKRQVLGLAACELYVPARRVVPPAVQHAGLVDVRRRARTDVGHGVLHEVLFLSLIHI